MHLNFPILIILFPIFHNIFEWLVFVQVGCVLEPLITTRNIISVNIIPTHTHIKIHLVLCSVLYKQCLIKKALYYDQILTIGTPQMHTEYEQFLHEHNCLL